MVQVALSIGSNCGDRRGFIGRMEELLHEVLGAEFSASALMETEPIEVVDEQSWYLNRILGGTFGGTPGELLSRCRLIEERLGRTGKGLRTPRTADVDILLFGPVAIETELLTIPHPGLLRPFAEQRSHLPSPGGDRRDYRKNRPRAPCGNGPDSEKSTYTVGRTTGRASWRLNRR